VLKDDRRDLVRDAQSLFEQTPPLRSQEGHVSRESWDLEGFTTWPQVTQPVRVVRSVERRSIRRQLDKKTEPLTSDWTWVTTLPRRIRTTSGSSGKGACSSSRNNRWFSRACLAVQRKVTLQT
jgi:hypothetical protein